MEHSTPRTGDGTLVDVARVRRMCASGELRRVREAARISRVELAEAVGVSPARLAEWEWGTMPRRDAALRLGPVLDELGAVVASV